MEGSLVAYKVFTNGSVLNASEVNDNLMNQAVITFTNSAARASAITSPVEGMVTYLADTDTYQFWNGSAWTALVTPASSGNAIINGAFEINQRNFSSTTTSLTYGFDRWFLIGTDGTSTYSSQSFTPGAAPIAQFEGTNFARLVSTGQTASNAQTTLRQKIEGVRTFTDQNVTVSFYAKAASGTPKIAVELNQKFGSGGSSDVNTYAGQVTLSTAFQRFSVTTTLPSISGKTIGAGDNLEVSIITSAGSDFNARTGSLGIQSNTFDIWGVQVEAGSVATPFRRNANSLQGELAACQRYYIRWGDGTQSFPLVAPSGLVAQTTEAAGFINLPSRMRAVSSVEFSNLRIQDVNLNNFSVTGVSLATSNFGGNTITVNFISSGMTTGRFCRVLGADSTSAFLAISGEL